ncbi:PIN domain-containing protein [Candidatus Marithrix sp. Canyon 246]|uniref:PIN domain-containing protein n=1 Tax=Candidatus Marithrix sp. Canyon 246 TaxID=1827136 RepID=UPI00084A20E3|nr:PIN domain-containing protein [Candidatus Marithrix sp. Canyon 246]
MILVDSDVMIDILRQYKPALDWLNLLDSEEIGIPGLVAMELIQGCRNSVELQKVEKILHSYRLYWSEKTDCERALNDYATYHLSNNIGMIDALIAELAVGLNVQLATFNTKHYRVIKNLQIIQPYQRIE